jgi:hypothetical protein
MNPQNLGESLQNAKNQIFWRLRSHLRFRRGGYKETGAGELDLSPKELAIERAFNFSPYRNYLSANNYRKNLWTLWLMERTLAPHLRSGHLPVEILEPGCQDFSRLFALRAFFRKQGTHPRITGLELDPFPVLHDFHSRWDKAKYYLNCEVSADRYLHFNFFDWFEYADLICCFYPFVSTHPALAWGIPATFGNPKPWIESFTRNLRPGGLLLVVHQGDWEEEDFDAARAGFPLRLLQRETLESGFYPLPYPACVSVYRREEK